jgi:uncharacterized membrane protein YadS
MVYVSLISVDVVKGENDNIFYLQMFLILILILAIVSIIIAWCYYNKFKRSKNLKNHDKCVKLFIIGFIVLIIQLSLQLIFNII